MKLRRVTEDPTVPMQPGLQVHLSNNGTSLSLAAPCILAIVEFGQKSHQRPISVEARRFHDHAFDR